MNQTHIEKLLRTNFRVRVSTPVGVFEVEPLFNSEKDVKDAADAIAGLVSIGSILDFLKGGALKSGKGE